MVRNCEDAVKTNFTDNIEQLLYDMEVSYHRGLC